MRLISPPTLIAGLRILPARLQTSIVECRRRPGQSLRCASDSRSVRLQPPMHWFDPRRRRTVWVWPFVVSLCRFVSWCRTRPEGAPACRPHPACEP